MSEGIDKRRPKERESRAPHAATVAQPKRAPHAATTRGRGTPHPATVAQQREAHPAAHVRAPGPLVQRTSREVPEVDRFITGTIATDALQDQTIVVPGIGGCSSGLVTVEWQGAIHYFAFHEQQATDRAKQQQGWPNEAFAAWWDERQNGNQPRASILYSTSTDTIKLINRSGITLVNEKGLSHSYGPKHSTVMVESFKTITYRLDHSDMSVEDPEHFKGIKTYAEYVAWLKENYFKQTTKTTTKKNSECLIL